MTNRLEEQLDFMGSTLLCVDIRSPAGLDRLLAEPLKYRLPIGV